MNKLSKDSKIAVVDFISSLVRDLQEKISVNDITIANRKIASAASLALAADVLKIVKMVHTTLNDESVTHEDKVTKSLEMLTALSSSLENLPTSEREEILRLEASQDGMRRVIDAVHDSTKAYDKENNHAVEKNDLSKLQDIEWDDT